MLPSPSSLSHLAQGRNQQLVHLGSCHPPLISIVLAHALAIAIALADVAAVTMAVAVAVAVAGAIVIVVPADSASSTCSPAAAILVVVSAAVSLARLRRPNCARPGSPGSGSSALGLCLGARGGPIPMHERARAGGKGGLIVHLGDGGGLKAGVRFDARARLPQEVFVSVHDLAGLALWGAAGRAEE